MTEVASLLHPADHRLTTVRHYEAGPPVELGAQLGHEQGDSGDTYATTKEEEWVSTKKTEVTNTKQIETRVKRQVVLEDGKVVEDSGPQVTTNTTEDTETKEHHQTELRKLGGDEPDGAITGAPGSHPSETSPAGGGRKQLAATAVGTDGSKWVSVANPEGVVREVKEKRVLSREETEEVKETEDVHHYGDITDKEFLSAVGSGVTDLRRVLRTGGTATGNNIVVSTGPRLVRDTVKSNKVTDTEDTRELSSIRPDGKIVTETERTTEHEEVKDDELPEDQPDQTAHKESSQRYFKARDQQDVDYYADGVKIAHEMRYKAETMEADRRGEGVDDNGWDSLSARARKRQTQKQPHRYRSGVDTSNNPAATTTTPLDRKDALTKKPLDFDFEEETRKVETSKWLENHFGSESRSSKDSMGDEDELPTSGAAGEESTSRISKSQPPKTSFFNVTIKSQPTTTTGSKLEAMSGSAVNTNVVGGGPYGGGSGSTTLPRGYGGSVDRVVTVDQPERDNGGGYFQGITEWSDRRQTQQQQHHHQQQYQHNNTYDNQPYRSNYSPRSNPNISPPSPPQDYHTRVGASNTAPRKPTRVITSPTSTEQSYRGPMTPDYDRVPRAQTPEHYVHQGGSNNRSGGLRSMSPEYSRYQQRVSPLPDYRVGGERLSPGQHLGMTEDVGGPAPTPPQRKRAAERQQRQQRTSQESRYDSGYRTPSRTDGRDEPLEEPPPDYSPPSPPPMPQDKKTYQKTRFAMDNQSTQQSISPTSTVKKNGNIIGQSIRKLVGKLRSASAERKAAKIRAKQRSPSPTYQAGVSIDRDLPPQQQQQQTQTQMESVALASTTGGGSSPLPPPAVQRYYLGEDPFAGSIYGRENKYDGVVKPVRVSRRGTAVGQQGGGGGGVALLRGGEDERSQSTLGRITKSTSNQQSSSHLRTVQTLPRQLKHEKPTRLERNPNSSTINVSIINNISSGREDSLQQRSATTSGNIPPTKPVRSYRSGSNSLARSKSFNTRAGDLLLDTRPGMYKSNPQLNRLDEVPVGLKSPGLISSISRSQRDLTVDGYEEVGKTERFTTTGRFTTGENGHGGSHIMTTGPNGVDATRRVFMKDLKTRAPELFKTLHENDSTHTTTSTSQFETPTRLLKSHNTNAKLTKQPETASYNLGRQQVSPSGGAGALYNRRGSNSNSSDNFSETYRTTSRGDDPMRPSVTNTVQSFSRKTLPGRDGRSMETIEQTETKSVTKSHYNSRTGGRNSPVVIQVRSYQR